MTDQADLELSAGKARLVRIALVAEQVAFAAALVVLLAIPLEDWAPIALPLIGASLACGWIAHSRIPHVRNRLRAERSPAARTFDTVLAVAAPGAAVIWMMNTDLQVTDLFVHDGFRLFLTAMWLAAWGYNLRYWRAAWHTTAEVAPAREEQHGNA